ncbi:MAG: hypothetical protein HFJ55_01600 [Clostridia bacterium]|nr:hypothetical protein [Clostridia bacterium]
MEKTTFIINVTVDNQRNHFDIQSELDATQTIEALRKAAESLEQAVVTFPTSNYTS